MPPGTLLQKALENTSKKKHEVSSRYEQFLHARKYLEKKGWTTLSDSSCSLDAISLKFMFSFPRVPHTYEHSNISTSKPTAECRREHLSNHSKSQSELVDGSLVNIFNFYCKIQLPGSKLGAKPTFGEISEANQSLSYLGIVTFLRDFGVIPSYALSENVSELWKAQTAARNRTLGHSMDAKRAAVAGSVAFLEFLEFLCKVALLAFPRDSGEKAVSKLAKLLRLDDDGRVRHIISQRGASSCTRINEPHAIEGQGRITSQMLIKESEVKHAITRKEKTENTEKSRGIQNQVKTKSAASEEEKSSVLTDSIRFNLDLRDTVEWRRRYGELVREQVIVPTSDLDMSSLQLSAPVMKVLSRYDPHLIEELQLFVFAVRRSWAAIHVPALDLGTLTVGSINTVQVMVKNSSSDPIAISPPIVKGKELNSAVDFTLEAATTVYPGLCFNFLMAVSPTLSKSERSREVVGCVDLEVKKLNKKAVSKPTVHSLAVYHQIKS